jgi:glutathione peroxidase
MNIYQFQVKTTDSKSLSLKAYEGKVLLIVNTATKCGFTPQYDGLEALYKKYKDQGFEVLDFPCNQFMNQAPGTNEELKSFCELTFGTTFQTFAKVDVNGNDADPLFVYLREQKPKDYIAGKQSILSKLKSSDAISWNFTKFLVDRQGSVVERFAPGFQPKDLESFIEQVL